MSQASSIETIMRDGPVIPVIVIRDRAHAVPLARALVAGGVRVLEVTLRTEAALDAIRAMRAEVPEAIVGAGTVLSPEQLRSVAELGVAFAVSPGITDRLLDAASDTSVPLLPGVATAGEVMRALDRGYRHLKFFPAEPAGGSPLPEGAGLAPAGGSLLPDRRNRSAARHPLSGARERAVRRGLLARAAGRDGRAGTGSASPRSHGRRPNSGEL